MQLWVVLKNIFARSQSYSASAGVNIGASLSEPSCIAMGRNSPDEVEWNKPMQLGTTNLSDVSGLMFLLIGATKV